MNIDLLIKKAERRVALFESIYDDLLKKYINVEDNDTETLVDLKRLGNYVSILLEQERDELIQLISERDNIEARWRE